MYSGVARSSYRQHCWSGWGHLSHEVRTGTPQRERSGIGRGTPQSANQLTDWRRRRKRRKDITYERIGIHLFQKLIFNYLTLLLALSRIAEWKVLVQKRLSLHLYWMCSIFLSLNTSTTRYWLEMMGTSTVSKL